MSGGKGGTDNAPSDREMRATAIPIPELRRPITNAIRTAQDLYESGRDWSYGPGIVQGLDPAQTAGINSGLRTVQTVQPGLSRAYNFASDVGTGRQIGQAPGQRTIEGIGAGNYDRPAQDAYGELMGRAMQGTNAGEYLDRTARGDMIGGNPHLDSVVNASVGDATRALVPALEGRMSQAGRLGGNAEAVGRGDIARQLGNVASGLRYQDYGNERGLQQQAQLALPGVQATEIGTGLAAAGGAENEQWRNLQTRLAASQAAGDNVRADRAQSLQAAGMTPGLAGAQFMGADRQIGYGRQRQDQDERVAAEANARHQYGQTAEWDRLQQYLGSLGGIAGMANGNAGLVPQEGTDPTTQAVGNISSLLGAGTGIASLFLPRPPVP